nr:hypothetical protein CTI12_AA325620 [Tanacetum cinerariifolium]
MEKVTERGNNKGTQDENVGQTLISSTADPSIGRSSYVRTMIELQADVELKDTIRVEYEWKPPRCSSGNIFCHVSNECLKNLSSDVVFKNTVNTSRKRNKNVVPRQGVGNSIPLDALNSIENDHDFGMNEGNSKLAGKGEPLVPMGNVDSESEVKVVFDETENSMASTSFKVEVTEVMKKLGFMDLRQKIRENTVATYADLKAQYKEEIIAYKNIDETEDTINRDVKVDVSYNCKISTAKEMVLLIKKILEKKDGTIENNKPPDPILEEFSTLTGMSSEGINHKPFVPTSDGCHPKPSGRPKGDKNNVKGVRVKVKSPKSASAGAGAILKRLRSSKMVGKGRSHSGSSPNDVIRGKRPVFNSVPIDDVLFKMLDRIAFDKSISKPMVFKEGICDADSDSCNKQVKKGYCLINGNDSSFIKKPSNHVFTKTILELKVLGKLKRMAVVVGRVIRSVFGNVHSMKGILKNPTIGLTRVQIGPSMFHKPDNAWSSFNSGVKAMNSDRSLNIESFAEKMKKGVEDRDEKGMKVVLESGPWMVNNIPLVLNVWEPGIWLDKVEPSTILIWVCVYGIPMKLCNGNGIGKIFTGIGKPVLMDKLTKERCLKKSGKLDFARVLVEVSASDDLPNFLKIEYPCPGDRPARVGKLEVKYHWKPPLCTHCYTFGHATVSCKIRPGSEEEIAKKATKDALKNGEGLSVKDVGRKINEDCFVTLGGTLVDKDQISRIILKPPLSSKYNENFKPKVLVRGSGSKGKLQGIVDKNIRVTNSFHDPDKKEIFNEGLNEEDDKIVWPDHGMEPYIDNDDVELENEDMADVMRPEKSNDKGLDEPSERSMGSSSITAGMEDFRKCLFKAEISDIMMSGLQFTWNKSPGNPNGLLKKLDRVMAVLNIPSIPGAKPKPFKFANFIVLKAEFLSTARNVCDSNSSIEMVKDPSNVKLRSEELAALNAYKVAFKDEEIFLKQRAKVTWLSEGDFNTKYFHNVMRERKNKNRIDNVEDMEGKLFSGPEVGLLFVKHFEKVLDAECLVRPISDEEIKSALFSMEDDKAPGLDGFSSKNFKFSWSIVGFDFTKAIHDFFFNGKLLKEGMKGLRQGDPLSPYLFIMVMEVLSLMINRKIVECDEFKFHWRCSKVKLTHLYFAEDLMIFSNGDVGSVSVIKVALNEFSGVSGLVPNMDKRELQKGKAKVKWEDVCGLKTQGGLGIKSVHCWNVALISKHVWNFVSKKDSLSNGEWKWSAVLRDKFAFLIHLPSPLLFLDRKDKVFWKSNAGKIIDFSVKDVWNDLFLLNLMSPVPDDLYQAIDYILAIPLGNSIWSIIQRLVIEQVRFTLMSLRVRRSLQVLKATDLWNVHVVESNKSKCSFASCCNSDGFGLKMAGISCNDKVMLELRMLELKPGICASTSLSKRLFSSSLTLFIFN